MKTEIAEIKEQFKRVLEYSQEIDDPHIDKLFDTFMERKSYFIEQFDGFIKEIPNVVFTLDQETKDERVTNFLNKIDKYHLIGEVKEFEGVYLQIDNKTYSNYNELGLFDHFNS